MRGVSTFTMSEPVISGKAAIFQLHRYFSTPMDDAHFWNAMVYVEQNPQRASLVAQSFDWHWSSAATHLRGEDDGLLDLSQWRQKFTPFQWKQILELGLRDAELLGRIREATVKGWPLGSTEFLDGMAATLGRPVRPGSKGRKAKAAVGIGI
jgi:putative transposase